MPDPENISEIDPEEEKRTEEEHAEYLKKERPARRQGKVAGVLAMTVVGLPLYHSTWFAKKEVSNID
ncbi:MAG: hypothetical protein ACQESA_02860 [Patescibacteria group bacterium]